MKLLRLALVLIVCAPVAFVLTFLLSPFWSWVEATYKIESIGHSGPSDWCFYVIYFLVVAVGLLLFATGLRRKSGSPHR